MVSHYEVHALFVGIEHQLQENIPHQFLHYSFFIVFAFRLIALHIPLMAFSTINNISLSAKRSNFTLVFFKVACHAYSGGGRNFAGSNS